MKEYRFYKEEDGKWYVDLPDFDGDKSALEMVCGADKMLELCAEGKTEVTLKVDTEPFEGSDLLNYIKPNELYGGAYYFMEQYQGEFIVLGMWLCEVMNFVFPNGLPEKLYIAKK